MKKKTLWFRFYTEALDDPKVQRLPPHLFKTWVNLLCLAGANGGKFPSLDDIAFRLRMSVHDVQQQFDDLTLAGLIDIGNDGKREPHNWMKRQFVSDTSTERVRKHRQKKEKPECNTDETFHGTPPEAETESETETKAEGNTDRQESDAEHEDASVGRTPAYGDLKRAFNGSTETMLAFVERIMGGHCRPNAEQWLAGTVSAHGASFVAQAFAIMAEKQAANEIVSRPLTRWSNIAAGLKANARASAVSASPKRTLADALREADA